MKSTIADADLLRVLAAFEGRAEEHARDYLFDQNALEPVLYRFTEQHLREYRKFLIREMRRAAIGTERDWELETLRAGAREKAKAAVQAIWAVADMRE